MSIYSKLADAGHLLVAGITGSGKSVVLSGIICELIERGDTKLFLADPKRVDLREFSAAGSCEWYADDAETIYDMLYSLGKQMDARYEKMIDKGQKTFCGPRMVLVIDELADLLMYAPNRKAIKAELLHLLLLGRAAKISVIAATQAPSRKVLSAELMLNFTDCLGLRCKFEIESKQIVGVPGCEALPRNGAGIYTSPDFTGKVELPMVESDTIKAIVDQDKPKYMRLPRRA